MMYCFKPTLDPDSIEAAIKNVENHIVNLKGKIIKSDKLGRKKLSYDVRKFRDGFYVSTFFEADPDKIKTLKRNMKLNENVIRELTIRIDEPDKYPSLSGQPQPPISDRKPERKFDRDRDNRDRDSRDNRDRERRPSHSSR